MANKETLNIIKIGGNIISNPDKLQDFLNDFAQLKGPKILVHGGGKTASTLLENLGITPKMEQGRRITDAPTLEVVTMVYAGLINKNLVAHLQSKGVNALGLSGADLNCIQAHKRKNTAIDYGFAGDVDQVDHQVLSQLLSQNVCPVFCAITHDKKGQLLNTNADTITAEVAKALCKIYSVQVVYCFEKSGVLRNPEDNNSLIPEINSATYQQLVKARIIVNGMIPKMDNAFSTLKHGVQAVYIANATILKTKSFNGGTKVCL